MTADVLIQRCTLRVSRHGGWSWGADPGALLRAVLLELPRLIGERLAAAWPEGVERTIAAPLRLHLSLRSRDLQALASTASEAQSGVETIVDDLSRDVDAWVGELVQREAGSSPASSTPAASADLNLLAEASHRRLATAGTVLTVLQDWMRRDLLMDALLSFAPASLVAWHEALLRELSNDADEGEPSDPEDLDALTQEFAAWPLPLAPGRTATLIRRVGLLVAAVQRLRRIPLAALLTDRMRTNAAFALPPAEPLAPGVGAPDGDALVGTALGWAGAAPSSRLKDGTPPHPPGPTARTRNRSFERRVPCALPFLLLGPLSRTGYLQAVAAVFEAGGLAQCELSCLAIALARKVLDPPLRGWYRDPGVSAAAAALAAREAVPADLELAAFSRHMAPHVTPLDAMVAGTLIAGHARGAALLLRPAVSGKVPGWLLFEAEGMFPIAWHERLEALFPRLAALGGEILLVPQDAASQELLARLDDAGFRFVTDAAPGRGESWRGLHRDGLRAWSNDRQSPAGALLAAAGRLESAGRDSASLWAELVVRRPGLPIGSDDGVERSLALAAALALGSMAWQLWGGAEPVSPLLALQRFADLDARVVVEPDRVQVHLPLGRRFLDLEQVGLLEEVADVPWLDGRIVRFARG